MEKTNFQYTPNYCEENVYHLLKKLLFESQSDAAFHVVFISNEQKSVAIWGQSAGDPLNNYLVVWDYHVILLGTDKNQCLVYDLDSVVGFPVPFGLYQEKGLRSNSILPDRLRRCYRVIRSDKYLHHFSSDRRHMIDSTGSGWLAPPPPYKCIRGSLADHENTLPHYWSMENPVTNLNQFSSSTGQIFYADPYGVVLTEPAFFQLFSDFDQYIFLRHPV